MAGPKKKDRAPAIYQDHEVTHRADTCTPLSQAADSGQIELAALARGSYPGRRIDGPGLPGLRSVGVWNATVPQGWGLDWHRNEGIELTLLETGRLAFGVQGQPLQTLKPGSLTVTRPWQSHCVGDPNVTPGRLHWLILDVNVRRPNQKWKWPDWLILTKKDLGELTELLHHNEQPVWPAGVDVTRCFRRISDAIHSNGDQPDMSRLGIRINEMFVLLLDMLRRQRMPLDEGLASSQRTVELFLSELRRRRETLSHPWTGPEMAEQCGLGVTYFIKYCKQLTNMTPAQYLNRNRLELASELLRADPDMPVSEVARAAGFSTGQYFASAFRKQYKCTPREYRSRT